MNNFIKPNIQFSRIKLKSLTSATFSIPTTPIDTTDEQYMVEGNFAVTDLLDCEMGIQKNDKTLNVRIDDEILTFQLGTSTASIGLTSGNGTTFNTDRVDLGGTLTQDTIIEGDTYNLSLGTTGSQLSNININSIQGLERYEVPDQGLVINQNPGGISSIVDAMVPYGSKAQFELHPGDLQFHLWADNGDTYSYLYLSNDTYDLYSIDNANNSSAFYTLDNSGILFAGVQGTSSLNSSGLRLDNTSSGYGFKFIDGRSSGAGLEYDSDYSTNYTDRSLVDKQYVDNAIIGASTFSVDYIDFNTSYTPTQNEGRIHWDQDYGTLDVDLEGNNINLKVGLDNLYYIKNQSGSTINKGSVVRASGTLGSSGRILGSLMTANGSVPYYYTLGIAGENILDGEDGYVYDFGLIRGLDTTGTASGETWVDGDILYVSSTISGGLTKVEPIEPNLKIQMAIVIDADSNGSIFVRPDLGANLGDLHNIQTTGQSDGDLISYNQPGGYWQYTKNLNGDYTISGTLSATSYYGDGSNLTGIVDTNFSNTDLTLTGNRTHQLNNFDLTFANGLLTTDRALIINSFKDVFTRGKGVQNNLVLGFNTGRSITTAANNVILGDLAGQNITTASNTVLIGRSAGAAITTSANQTIAIGRGALENITTSSDNTAVGYNALNLQTGSQFNVALGSLAGSTLTTGGSNVFIGRNTQPLNTNDNSSIIIGTNAVGYGSNTAVLGNSSITLTRLRGRVEMDTIVSAPTITDNSSFAIWFNSNVPTIRVKDALGAQSDIPFGVDTNLANGDLTQTDPIRTYNIGTGNQLWLGDDVSIGSATSGNAMAIRFKPLSMTNQQIINLADPTLPQHATNKRYVDDNFIGKTTPVFNKTFTLESPTATEDFSIFRTDTAITVQEVVAVSTGTSPSTTYTLRHSTDRNAAGNLLTTSGTTTSTTTGNVATLSVVAIPANSWIWLETTAATGTDVKLTIDIRYTID